MSDREDEKDPPQSTGQELLMRSTIYSLRSQVYWLWKPDPKRLLYPPNYVLFNRAQRKQLPKLL